MDVVVQSVVSIPVLIYASACTWSNDELTVKVPRATLVGAITGAEHGKQYWMDCQHYYKCAAMIVENLDKAKQKSFTIGKSSSPSPEALKVANRRNKAHVG